MNAVVSKNVRLAFLSLWFTLPCVSICLAGKVRPTLQATSEVSFTYVCKSQGRVSTLKVNDTKQTLEWLGHTYKITETSCGRAGWHAERGVDGCSDNATVARPVEIGLKEGNEMKKPEEFERRKPLSKEQKQARKERQEVEARMASAENAKAAEAFSKNRERLRAERLAREVGVTTPPKR